MYALPGEAGVVPGFGLRDVGAAAAAGHARLPVVAQQVRAGHRGARPRHHRGRGARLAGELAAVI